jgi:fermentation-respiration switch protein FrsA (DUF1100 family)
LDIALFVIGILVLVLAGLGYYLTTQAIYPKVFLSEAVYDKEIEMGRLVEDTFNSWPRQQVCLPSRFGYNLTGLYFPIEGSEHTVVLSHGITWGMYGMAQFMPMFRRFGFNILIYDLRNHGLSGGKNTTFGYYEKYDLKTMVDWAFDQIGPLGQVGAMGISLGAGTTLQYAAIDPRLSFVISDCSYSDLVRLLKYRLWDQYHLPAFPILNIASIFSGLITGMRFTRVSPEKEVEKVLTPIFFIHSKGDSYILPQMCEELYQHKTQGHRKIWLAPDGGHAESYWKNQAEYHQQVRDYLTEIKLLQPEPA